MGKKTAKKEKKVKWWMVIIALVVIGMLAPSNEDEEVSKEMPTQTFEATFTPAPTFTPIPTKEPTETPTPEPTATSTPTPTPKPTNTPTPTMTPKPAKIIGNATSNKYHTRNCGFLPDEENRVYFDSVEDAKAAGMTLCGHCNRY